MKILRKMKSGAYLLEVTVAELDRFRHFAGVVDAPTITHLAFAPTITRKRIRSERKARRTPEGMVARTEARMEALKAAYSRVCENESARSKARTVKGGLFA